MDLNNLYKNLLLIRKVEEKIVEIYDTDKIKSPVHLSIGQEYISLAACYHLSKKDIVFGTYRSHALFLSKGGSVQQIFYELFGKNKSFSKGKAGSMHLSDPKVGMIFSSAIVSSTIPLAAGYAYNFKINNKKNIVLSFFGDGATEEGVFFETLNFAKLKNLPIVFICENNLLAINTPIEKRQSNQKIIEKVSAFKIKSYRFQSNNIVTLIKKLEKIIFDVRKNPKPIFIEFVTSRLYEHVGIGFDIEYTSRTLKDLNNIKKNDALLKLKNKIEKKEIKKIENEVNKKIETALINADKDQFPQKKELFKNVY